MTPDTESGLPSQVEALTRDNTALRQSVTRLRRVRDAVLLDAREARAELACLRAQRRALGAALQPFLTSGTPAQEGEQELSLDDVRDAWVEVLDLVKAVKRVTHARLSVGEPVWLDTRVLTVGFPTPTLARQFTEGLHLEILEDALLTALGRHLQVAVQGPPPSPAGAWIATRSEAPEHGTL